MANTYGLHFIKIRDIWFFRGQKAPLGVLTIIRKSRNSGNLPYLVATTYGLNFIIIGGIWIFRGGQKTPITGVTCDLWCPFSNSAELFQSKVMCENLVWIGWNQRYVNFQGGQKPPIKGVTCDLWCPFSNLAELFQSKVMCKNLVQIGWAFQELSCPQTYIQKKNNKKNKQVKPLSFDPHGGGFQ